MTTPYYTGKVKCCVIEDPVADLILGNLPGVHSICDNCAKRHDEIGLVTKRLQQKNRNRPMELKKEIKTMKSHIQQQEHKTDQTDRVDSDKGDKDRTVQVKLIETDMDRLRV